MTRGFASDNNSGIHPAILEAIVAANAGHVVGYGNDLYTREAEAAIRRHFGDGCYPFFVYGGTGGNVIGLQALVRPYEAVICADTAHIHADECGAVERHAGCKLLTVPTADGKLTTDLIAQGIVGLGDPHSVQPKVVSITQATELGTIYTAAEIRTIADFVHERGMYLHVDGARFANAAAALGVSLREISTDAGVDVLTFGGTKNGLMLGEAVIVFDERLREGMPFLRMQGMQLSSKMRFISAQFTALLTDDLWLRNAQTANSMASLLASEIRDITTITITQEVQTNAIFARMPREAVEQLRRDYFFYDWDEAASEVRWVCSFDTTAEDVTAFAAAIRKAVG